MLSDPHQERVRRALMFLLGAIVVASFTIRIVAIAEPLGIDQSLWASAVRGMDRGQLLYRDVWEQRPPGIYWIYLAGFRLFGWQPATVVWLDIVASASTCLLLFLVVRKLTTTSTALLAAALYAVLTMPAWLYGYGGFLERSVCETFITVCVVFGAWSAAVAWQRSSSLAALGVGLAAGAAVVLKPNAGLYLLALTAWMAIYAERRVAIRLAALAMSATAVVPILALLWLWRLHLLGEARIAVVDFNRFYVSQGFEPAAYAVSFAKAVWLRIKTDPLWLAGVTGSLTAVWLLARQRALAPLPALGLLLGGTAALVMIVNGARLFNSYFINPLPALTLMAAWLLGDAWAKHRGRQALAAGTLVVMALLLVTRGYGERVVASAQLDLDRLRDRIDAPAYLDRFGGYANERGYSARANAELADYVRQHSSPDDRIFLLGISGAGVYFASDRLTAHRFLRVNFFVDTDFPDPRFRLDAVVADLAAAPPAYLIFERLHSRSTMAQTADNLPHEPIVRTLLDGYRLDTQIEDFTIYKRLAIVP